MTSSPNIVIIFTDQQRFDTMAAYGNESIKTPNLNKLSRESAVFKRAYVSQPVCTPSRGTILTGLYPHTHGLVKNNMILGDDVPTVAELIKGSSYRSGYFGKWHLGNEVSRQHGFDEWISTEDYYYRDHFDSEAAKGVNCSYHHFLVSEGFKPDLEDGKYTAFSRMFATRIPERYSKPAYLAGEADRFVGENKDRPFVLFVNFLEPHPPYFSAYDEMYDPDQIELPPNFHYPLPDNVPEKYRLNTEKAREKGRHFPLNDDRAWRKQIARYWGCVSLVDTYVGKILDSIERRGMENNTIVIFTSDHGDMMGDFGMLAKGVMFEPSVRVPLLVRIPGVTDGAVIIEEPVSQVDLAATLLDMMGEPWEGRTQGKSLYPVIKGEEGLHDNDVFIEHKTGSAAAERSAISGDGWRLTLIEPDGRELYNRNADPFERRNLYYDKKYSGKIIEMTDRLISWQAQTGDQALSGMLRRRR